MSAYVVDRESIAYLVTAALQLPERHDSLRWHHAGESRTLHAGDYPAASRLGQMLWDENIRSVCFRYDEPYAQVDRGKLPGTNGESYEFDFAAGEALTTSIEPAVVLGVADCLEYQSCEHPEWAESEAYAILNSIRRVAWQSLAGYQWHPPTIPVAPVPWQGTRA